MTDQNQNPVTPENNDSLFSSEPQGNDGGAEQPNEGKELKLSQEELNSILKQNSNAQSHIKTIQDENKELRNQLQQMQQELSNSASFQDLLDGLGNQSESSNMSEPTAPQLDADQLRSQIKEEVLGDIFNAQTELQQQANLQTSLGIAKEKFGDQYEDQLTALGEEMGLSMDNLDTLAKSSPQAFAKLLGGDQQQIPASTIPTTSSFSTTPSQNNAKYDFAKIAQLKKYDTEEGRQANRLWQSPEFQREYREYITSQKG